MKYIVIGTGNRGMIYGSWARENGIEIGRHCGKAPRPETQRR